MVKFIDYGVTAPKGFLAAGILVKFKQSRTTPDFGLLCSFADCNVAGMFTQNKVAAECVKWSRKVVAGGVARAIITNSGNANCCTGEAGMSACKTMAESAARSLSDFQNATIDPSKVLVASTGVIAQAFPIEKVTSNIGSLTHKLSADGHSFAQSIMTTDTVPKEVAVEFTLGGKQVHIGCVAKGSGMIHINLGTMICVITTDCAISADMLQASLRRVVPHSLNRVSVDGDTSTNDTCVIMANGLAGNSLISKEGGDFDAFCDALQTLLTSVALKLASDGEGASRLVVARVAGASSQQSAEVLAKSVISSNLVKAAMFGKDANCGRVLCALGYSGEDFDPSKVSVEFCPLDTMSVERYRAVVQEARRPPFRDKAYVDENTARTDAEKSIDVATPEVVALIRMICGDNSVAAPADFAKSDSFPPKGIEVIHNGTGLSFDEHLAKDILSSTSVLISVDMACGNNTGWAYGCDLTYDYVKINGDYRT